MADTPDRAMADNAGSTVPLRLALRDALRALPPRQRAIIVLRYLEDLGVDEIARILGCRVGTVGSQLSRALVKLRGRMDNVEWRNVDE